MTSEIQAIPLVNLLFVLAPVALVIGILFRWSLQGFNALYSVGRMALQLTLVGFLLTALFNPDNPLLLISVLAVLVLAPSWNALS